MSVLSNVRRQYFFARLRVFSFEVRTKSTILLDFLKKGAEKMKQKLFEEKELKKKKKKKKDHEFFLNKRKRERESEKRTEKTPPERKVFISFL